MNSGAVRDTGERAGLACADCQSARWLPTCPTPATGTVGRVWIAALILAALAAGATRPQYGGTLRAETRMSAETPDPPPLLGAGFQITRWEADGSRCTRPTKMRAEDVRF